MVRIRVGFWEELSVDLVPNASSGTVRIMLCIEEDHSKAAFWIQMLSFNSHQFV